MYNILVGLFCLNVCREGILDVVLYHILYLSFRASQVYNI